MNSFRLVILDYAKNHLDNPTTQKLLNDLIIIKQKNYEQTDPHLVVMDKHDMIGTHFLVYDVANIYNPKLILAIRTTFEDRAMTHRLKTPIQDLVSHMDNEAQKAYHNFKQKQPVLADCNSWFVDPSYSFKNSGLKLSDIGYAMVYTHISRFGFDHIIGCTNEKYRASRWLEHIGHFDNQHIFKHPFIPGPHMFIIVDRFKVPYLQSIYSENKYLFDNLMEVLPPGFSAPTWSQAKSKYLVQSTKDNVLPFEKGAA